MKKYVAVAKISWLDNLAYRGESLIWFVLELIPSLYIIFLWISMERLGNLPKTETAFLIGYQIASIVIVRVTSSHFEDWLIDHIKDGTISTQFLKPYSYPKALLSIESTWRVFGLIYLLPVFVVFVIMLKEYLIIPHYSNLLLTIPFLNVAFFQRYFISLIIATFAFWIDQSKALIHLKWMAEGVVGGGWLPLLYFPQWFQKIASFTPFYYWYHVPITILLNPTSLIQVLVYLIQGLAWTLVLWLMHLYFWKKSINKYSAVGS